MKRVWFGESTESRSAAKYGSKGFACAELKY